MTAAPDDKVLHFGVFEVMAAQVGGTFSWTHPRSEGIDYMNVDFWIRTAKILEETGFDFLFFAGGYGYPIVDGDLSEVAVSRGINFSGLDADYLIPVLAQHTEKLGFVVTQSTGLDHPVQLARRFTTLDHLTGGRVGWNIVTGASQNAVAEVFGHDEMMSHDVRYEMAGEYVELAARFWETAWDDDAYVADRESGLFARRDGIHRVVYDGKHYSSRGYSARRPRRSAPRCSSRPERRPPDAPSRRRTPSACSCRPPPRRAPPRPSPTSGPGPWKADAHRSL